MGKGTQRSVPFAGNSSCSIQAVPFEFREFLGTIGNTPVHRASGRRLTAPKSDNPALRHWSGSAHDSTYTIIFVPLLMFGGMISWKGTFRNFATCAAIAVSAPWPLMIIAPPTRVVDEFF